MFVKSDIRREVLGGRESLLLQGDATMPQEALQSLAGQAQCVYIDPPFMTGEEFRRKRVYGESGWRTGKHAIQLDSYSDSFENREQYLKFLRGLIENSFLLLQETGIFCLHLKATGMRCITALCKLRACCRIYRTTEWIYKIKTWLSYGSDVLSKQG